MKKTNLLAVSALITASITSMSANADVINFDDVNTEFWIEGVTQGDFDVERSDDGLATLGIDTNTSYWNGNGTGRLLSWSNTGSTSGFELDALNGDLFSLNSFEFGNGYVANNNAVTSVTLTGLLDNGSIITDSFVSSANLTNISLSDSWYNLVSVEFRANGDNNRAVWDNIVVNSTSVPAPASIALFGLGLAGLGFSRKNKAA